MVKFLILFLIGLTVTDDDIWGEKFMMLLQHNLYRSFFQVDDLNYSEDLEKIAQSYAESFLKNPKDISSQYSGNTYKGSKLGENLYYGKNQKDIGEVAINTWFNEAELYFDSENPENYKSASHFTQLVWKSSKLLGCGIACDTEWCCVVCNYYPAGNVINEYDTNVFPPDLEKIEKYQFKVNKEKLENETPLEKFRKKITEKHNEYRKLHNAGDLERDSKLEKIAQKHAEYMLETDSSFFTSEKYDGEKIGQNLFYEFGDGDLDINKIVDKWYSKEKFYDFEKPGSEENKPAQQFINLVWKDTKKIGCGYACNEKECFAICTYYPSAGTEYIYSKNVLPESS